MSTLHTPTLSDDALIRKVMRRLIPFSIICFLLNYIDRVNISIAKFQMAQSHIIQGFDEHVYNFGVGIFFIGYFIFELPSNLIQQKVGPRRWIARIMISWGLISVSFMFIRGPVSFYILRFLLGLAEAGFFPGVILYLSYWVPHRYRARTAALFLTSTAIAGVIGNPLGGAILSFAEAHTSGLEPWQWLFLIEGIPSVILGLITFFFLTDTPAHAKWLSANERTRLTELLAHENRAHPAHHLSDFRHALSSFHTWMLSLLYLLIVFGFYTVNYYTPSIIKSALQPDSKAPAPPDWLIGAYSAIPFGAAAIGMILIARRSDRHNDRKFHLAFACLLITIGLGLTGAVPFLVQGPLVPVLTIAAISIGAIGAFGMFGPFWSLPPQFLSGTAVAAAFAIINSIGNLGGFLGPFCFNWFKDHTNHGQSYGLLLAAALALLAVILTLLAPIPKHPISD